MLKNCGKKKSVIAETASKLADKTRELNAREEDLDGRDVYPKTPEAPQSVCYGSPRPYGSFLLL